MNHYKYCIQAENLSKSFCRKGEKKRKLFSGFSIEVKPGEIVGLSGPSGCGKTTLGDILLGLKRPDTGKIFWNGNGINGSDRNSRMSLRPYFQKIYQDPPTSFPPHQTIKEALTDVVKNKNPVDKKAMINQRILAAIKDVDLDKELLNRYPRQLSGGEIQRFALSRVLLLKPIFLVADEPTSRLDLSVQAKIVRLLIRLAKERRMGVLFISHDPALLRVACNKVLSLQVPTSFKL
ncbi:MAG: dipeptide/oligopeptide/nickel ABC transporter ATP-binding protein [Desulfobacula sp.]|uniref:ABC transporter ATP-binding protein n=1 Tax=Desulfobacula sp. TaxID=2593537 RepID=UPI0025C025A4|nr:dipeptide/oligopeptide/nickel ABC transporter ATP-binding protein [Desulfobacula sp.]MCD4723101.1 dipeptide/oligopeptide/nickel ABC transporter ATP-binding protein [Desulfobacula sp.]